MNLVLKPVDKFTDPLFTADGQKRASVELQSLETLWFNTGTLCNLECINCYIESSPKNDALVYISHEEVLSYLNEINENDIIVREIGLTGGEPFMNPDILKIIENQIPLGRVAKPNEIAKIIEFLISDKNTYITGAGVDINGGQFLTG